MKLLELTLLDIDYLRPSAHGHQIYLSGQLMRGKPIGIWTKIDKNFVQTQGTFQQLTNITKD